MLGAGEGAMRCLDPLGACSLEPCWDCDRDLASLDCSSMSREGGLDVRPLLVVYASSSLEVAVMSGCCALPIRPVHVGPVGYLRSYPLHNVQVFPSLVRITVLA